MPFGYWPYPRALLPDTHWIALQAATDLVIRLVFIDLEELAKGRPFSELVIAEDLPRPFLHRYDIRFLQSFLECLIEIRLKMGLPGFFYAERTGEEIAMYVIKQYAIGFLDPPDPFAFDEWDSCAFEDVDHELLFDPAEDGIEHSEKVERYGMANMEYEKWFVPFRRARLEPPYTGAEHADNWDAGWAFFTVDAGVKRKHHPKRLIMRQRQRRSARTAEPD